MADCKELVKGLARGRDVFLAVLVSVAGLWCAVCSSSSHQTLLLLLKASVPKHPLWIPLLLLLKPELRELSEGQQQVAQWQPHRVDLFLSQF